MSDTTHLASTPHRLLSAGYLTTSDLRYAGISRHHSARLIEQGQLVRVRRGRFVPADMPAELIAVGRLGARLDCVSLLWALGVFVRTSATKPHVQFERGASRLPPRPPEVVAHWRSSLSPHTALTAPLVEAVAQACRCQSPRDAIATLDSAWHRGLLSESGIADVFALLPRRYRRLRSLLDPRSESGPETLVRLMLRGLGCQVELQVVIVGVGRVDLVVDGWLIVECDSRAHHSDWGAQRRDRRRDLAAAALGYTTVRPIAEDILGDPAAILAALRSALAHPAPRPGLRNSSNKAATVPDTL
jgi:very-short-patch-repair endonuclease